MLGIVRVERERSDWEGIERAQRAFRDAKLARAQDHDPGHAGSPQQADCRGYWDRRIHCEGASHQPDAQNEGPFAARAQPNGGCP